MASDPTSSQLPPPGDAKTLYVIDISGYVFRAYHAVPPLSNSKGEPTNATYGVTAMLQKLVSVQKPAMLAVAMDSKAPSFRKILFDGYKANRPTQPPDLAHQMERVRQIVEAYAIPCFQRDGVEADDIIATVVHKARMQDLNVVIVSADKDLLQLVTDRVLMYDTMREKVYGEAETAVKFGVPPSHVRDLLALTGDTSDNIPGVPSVGPKTAAGLLNEWQTLGGIYEHLSSIKRPALREKLETHREQAFLSQTLVSLKNDIDVELDVEHLRYGGADVAKLRELFTELEFSRLVTQLGPSPSKANPARVVLDLGELKAIADDLGHQAKIVIRCDVDPGRVMAAQWRGFGVCSLDGEAVYVPLQDGPSSGTGLSVADAVPILRPLLENADVSKISADIKLDEIVLRRNGIALMGAEFDVMLASYLLDSERHSHRLADIARAELGIELPTKEKGQQTLAGMETFGKVQAQDFGAVLDATRQTYTALERRLEIEKLSGLLRDVELPLAAVLARMEYVGVAVDAELLGRLSAEVTARLAELDVKCRELAGRDFNVGSPRQLEAILFDELKLPVVKKTKTARSTDADVLEELAALHPLPRTILEQRKLAKLKSTYLDALPREINTRTHRIHTTFNQAVAATGRLSSSDPNLQNIPIRDEVGRGIRKAFIAPPGSLLLSADYSQIELRLLAHLSHDPELVTAFQGTEDVHVRTARALFGVPAEGVTKEMRARAKTVNFAVIYGQTEFALARGLGIARAEAGRYIQAFFEKYAGVRAYLDRILVDAKREGSVRTLLGRRRVLPDLSSQNRNLRMQAERMACNAPIQGSAADILKLAMIAIDREITSRKLRSAMVLTVHDELVFEVPLEERDEMETLVCDKMQNVVALDVPLLVEHGWGESWGDAH